MAWTIADPLRRFRSLLLEETDGEKHRWKFRYARTLRYNGRDDWGGLAHQGRRTIEISTRLGLRRAIEIRIHETLHQTYPDLGEDAIKRGEDNISAVLTAAGVIPPARKRKR